MMLTQLKQSEILIGKALNKEVEQIQMHMRARKELNGQNLNIFVNPELFQ